MEDAGAMDVDDMDIDLGTDENVAALEAEAMQFEPQSAAFETGHTNGNSQPGLSNSNFQEDKVHMRGVDNFTTDDIKLFAAEHYPPEFTRIEWIDDTSANIQYASAELSAQALASFTNDAEVDPATLEPSQLRRAKRLSSHPYTELNVRIAFITDVKKPRARDASRFYLMNPDQDPRERRQRSDNRSRGGGRGSDRKYEGRPRDEEKATPFDVNLYDDDPSSLAARISHPRQGKTRSRSRSREVLDGGRTRTRSAFGRASDLVAQPSTDTAGRLRRDRSASPLGEGDGRYGFDEVATRGRGDVFRRRSLTPPRQFNGSLNAGKELLSFAPSNLLKISQEPLNSAPGKELLLNRSSAMDLPAKELFPSKAPVTGHRRKAAMDAADEHGADLFADRLAGPRLDSPSGRPRSRKLEERITGNGATTGPSLDLASRINGGPKPLEGFSIRGTATPEASAGFSIRGAAGLNNPRVKELFPDRSEGNEGKELFGGKIKGRGGPRRKAEDMFS